MDLGLFYFDVCLPSASNIEMQSNVFRGLVFGVLCMVGAMFWARGKDLKSAHIYVCEMVAQRSLFGNLEVGPWEDDCIKLASQITMWTSTDNLLHRLQDHLDLVGVSHLQVYGPVEDKRLWQGRAKETGISTWEINGRFIVSQVAPGSPADLLGVKPGDLILKAGGRPPMTRWQMQTAEGEFEFERQGNAFSVNIDPAEISIDAAPTLTEIKPGVGLLKIISFRREYFEKERWLKLISELKKYPRLIIDLRNNSGGNFVAMLRALSPFVCELSDLGRLTQPRRSDEGVEAFGDNLDDTYQIEHIEKFKEVPLLRFEEYGCYTGKVVALANSRTSSVAEIFSENIRLHPEHKLKGEYTAGDVVLAIWYGIPRLGKGYSLSIPEAIYERVDGSPLEGIGAEPEARLFYDLKDALQGKDTWIEQAF